MKNTILAVALCFVSTAALADFDLGVSGFSAVQKTLDGKKIYHYSNISSKTQIINGEVHFVSAQGGPCDETLNSKCRSSTDVLYMSVTNLLPEFPWPQVIVSPQALTLGENITGGVLDFTSQWSGIILFKRKFSEICKAASARGVAIDGNCEPSQPHEVVHFTINVVADYNNDGILNGFDDVVSFPVVVNSTIVAESCACNGSGLFHYELEAQSATIQLNDVIMEGGLHQLPVAIKAARFYYEKGPEELDGEMFGKISLESDYFELPVDQNTGELSTYLIKDGVKKGVRYYFRVALVDHSGNTGYLADSADANANHSVYVEGL